MKKITFTVTVGFTDKISSDEDIKEVAEKIAHAIKGEADNGTGIAPEDSEAITTDIEVNSDVLGVNVKLKVF